MIKSTFQRIQQNHFLLMVLCCTLPLIAIWSLSALGVLGSWGYYALLLICPLGHVLLMRVVNHGDCQGMKAPETVQKFESR